MRDSWERAASPRALLGIVGGLGPLASAEFLKTLYEENPFEVEQEGPACLLLSDPNVPDDNRAHGLNERISVKGFYDQLEFTRRLLKAL